MRGVCQLKLSGLGEESPEGENEEPDVSQFAHPVRIACRDLHEMKRTK